MLIIIIYLFMTKIIQSITNNINWVKQRSSIFYHDLEKIPSYLKNQQSQFKALNIKLKQQISHFVEQKLNNIILSNKNQEITKNHGVVLGGHKIFNLSAKEGILYGPKTDQSEIISDTFLSHDNQLFCREIASRIRTLDIYKSQLRSERDYLQNQVCQPKKLSPQKLKAIRSRINDIEQKMKMYESKMKATWASTNTPRVLFDKYNKETAKKMGIPILVNLRTHRVEFADEGISVNRSAAISDFVHAETNLQEMQDYLLLISAHKFVPAQIAYFRKYYNVEVINPLQRRQLAESMKKNIIDAYGESGLKNIKKLVNERRDVLRRQVLQDLLVHFREKPVYDANTVYGRTALLDPLKKPIKTDTGYNLNEKNQLMDMRAIYQEIDGAQIVFDLKNHEGPFFDMQGRIHMPQSAASKSFLRKNSSSTLNTLLMNISVQGVRKNTGIQHAINQEAFGKLKSMNIKGTQKVKIGTLQNRLQKKAKTDFSIAHKAIQLMRGLGYCSVDCYGGKDRTGYAMALETYHALRKKLKVLASKNPKVQAKYQSLLAKYRNQLIDNNGVAKRVVEDNTGFKVMKLSPFNLKLYVSGKGIRYLLGIPKRLAAYAQSYTLSDR